MARIAERKGEVSDGDLTFNRKTGEMVFKIRPNAKGKAARAKFDYSGAFRLSKEEAKKLYKELGKYIGADD